MPSLAGSFLVARRILKDPSFRQSVVLLLQHGEEGAFGLVVNRPASVNGLPFPVFAGGPCKSPGFIMLHGHSDWVEAAPGSEKCTIAPGVYLGDSSSLAKAGDAVSKEEVRLRLFSGYAGWGPEQLEGELASGSWVVVPADAEILFSTPSEDLWHNLLPPSIPEPSVN